MDISISSKGRYFFDYLTELRTRLLYCLAVTIIVSIVLLPFSNPLYHFLAKPLLIQLPHGNTLIATAVTASFLVPIKFTLIVALMVSIPFVLYQFWMFVAPALYQVERHWLWLLLLTSTLLFYLGICFAYFIIFPFLFKFFVHTAPADVTVLPDIAQYLNLVLQLFFAFGLVFEVPIIIVVLVATKVITIKKLAQKRRYFIVLAFIIAMLITPPDVVSQSLLAVPLCLLFEVGLLFARFVKPISRTFENDDKETKNFNC